MSSLPISVEDQGQTNWCWAAVGAGISNFRRSTSYRPCDVATLFLKAPKCCGEPGIWNKSAELSAVLQQLDLLRASKPALELDELAVELQARPVAARIVFFGNGLVHFVLITGCSPDGRVVVQDPSGPAQYDLSMAEMTFSYPSGGVWRESYLVI